MKYIKIALRDGTDEERLMSALACIIEGDYYRDQFPHIMPGVIPRTWRLDSRNDWFARLARRGEKPHANEPPVESDTLEVGHRYWYEPLDAIKPWLEYRFSLKDACGQCEL